MKKWMVSVLCVCLISLALPVSAHASTSNDDTVVVSTHGGETYMGTQSDWNDAWDSSNFTKVTNDDVNVSDDLIIKGGTVKDVSVSGENDLTIKGGTVGDATSDGDIIMSSGKADSLQAEGDIRISGGGVKNDVETDSGKVTLSGALTIGGKVEAQDVSVFAADSGSPTAVGDTVEFSRSMVLQGTKFNLHALDGQSSGVLTLDGCRGTVPALTSVTEIDANSDTSASMNADLTVDDIELSAGSRFATYGSVRVGKITGPGSLSFNAGKLTVEKGISDFPVFDLNGTAADGVTAFKANTGSISAGDAVVYGYGLSLSSGGDYDYFVLHASTGQGVSVSPSSVSVASGSPVTLTAAVSPQLSSFASGTQLCWKLIDPSSVFSISPSNNGDSTCTVRLMQPAGSSVYHATVAAYLADSNGNLLSGYKTAACAVTSSNTGSTGTAIPASTGLTLDTQTVTIPLGHKYCVLAVTSDTTPPKQMSYNSGVAVVGKASAYNYNGKIGWLYPITAVSGGGVTINIGGQRVLVTVA